MLIIGSDYHPSMQQIAYVDTETGESGERRLMHRSGEAESIDHAARVLSAFTGRTSEASTRQGISRRWPPRCELPSRQLFSVSQN